MFGRAKRYGDNIVNSDSDVISVLSDDGLPQESLKNFFLYENSTTVSIEELREKFGLF